MDITDDGTGGLGPSGPGAPAAATRWAVAWLCCACASAWSQPDPSGINFVTVGAPNNPAYPGPDPFDRVIGRGSVGYEYRMSETEVTTAQWMEYFNTFYARPDPLSEGQVGTVPLLWGAENDPTYQGPGYRYRLSSAPNAGRIPAYNLDWRTCAKFCNWLHNGKSSDPSAIRNGAYDVSTFGYSSPGIFTDQVTHNPDARYWIPTPDEWLKGAHYDPSNTNRDGWWLYPHRSDQPPIYGPPGEGQANAVFGLPGGAQYAIPLLSYPDVRSAWGLADVAGCATEWTEEIRVVDAVMYRGIDGSNPAYGISGAQGADLIYGLGAQIPGSSSSRTGLRLAATIPSSPTVILVAGGLFLMPRRSRRDRSGL